METPSTAETFYGGGLDTGRLDTSRLEAGRLEDALSLNELNDSEDSFGVVLDQGLDEAGKNNSESGSEKTLLARPVKLESPKHLLAPPGTEAYFKYGDEHYPESTVPPSFTLTDDNGHCCRYISNFLVYNKRGERLLPIEGLGSARGPALSLYGQLISTAALRMGDRGRQLYSAKSKKKRDLSGLGKDAPYPVRVELDKWQIEYGPFPSERPAIWLVSSSGCYYRLEQPAGRYKSTFASIKVKFDVASRILKTLQLAPTTSLAELCDLISYGTRNHVKACVIASTLLRVEDEKRRMHQDQLQSESIRTEKKFCFFFVRLTWLQLFHPYPLP